MITHFRTLTDRSDTQLIAHYARRWAADSVHVLDLPWRLTSWALDDPGNGGLWFDDGGQLAAWAVLQTPWSTVDYAVDPACSDTVFTKVLEWADLRAKAALLSPYGQPCWFAEVFSDQASRIHQLEACGYTCQADVGEDSWSKVLLCRTASASVRVYQPPAGYMVRSLAGVDEVDAYVALQRTVFGSDNMTAAWRTRTLSDPAYLPDLDVVVEAPNGSLAAFCVGWYDAGSQTGQVEPLGCHPDFTRYALGRVALSHTLTRLQARGAKQILVETDNYRNTALRLYQSFDFTIMRDILVYRKDFA